MGGSDDGGLAVGTLESTAESLCESGLNGTGKSLLKGFLDKGRYHGGDLLQTVEIIAVLAQLVIGAISGAVHDLHQRAESVDVGTDSSNVGVDGANLSGKIVERVVQRVASTTKVVVMSLVHLTQTVDIESKGTSGIKNASLDDTEDLLKNFVNIVDGLTTNKTLLRQGANDSLGDFANNIGMGSLLIVIGESSLDSVGRGDSSCLANNSVEVLTNILVTEQALDSVTNMGIAVLMDDLRITLLDATSVLDIESSVLLGATRKTTERLEMLVVVNNSLSVAVRSSGVRETSLDARSLKLLSHAKKDLMMNDTAICKMKRRCDCSQSKDAGRVSSSRGNLSGLGIIANSGVLGNGSVVDGRVTNGDGRTRGRGGRVVLSDSMVGRERIDGHGGTIVMGLGLSSHVGTSRSTRDVATARGDVANCKARDAGMTDREVVRVSALSSRDSDLGALRFHCASRWNEERLDMKMLELVARQCEGQGETYEKRSLECRN